MPMAPILRTSSIAAARRLSRQSTDCGSASVTKPWSRGSRSRARRTNEPARWTNAAALVLDSEQIGLTGRNDDAINAPPHDRRARWRRDVRQHQRGGGSDQVEGDGFPRLSNLPIFAAQHKDLFTKQGLAIDLLNTPNSDVLRDGLAKGDHQIAHAAVDNAVAMVELAKADVVIVTGGDNGFNRIFVQPEINGYADLRGQAVVVDAPNTAYALLRSKVPKDPGRNKSGFTDLPVRRTTG